MRDPRDFTSGRDGLPWLLDPCSVLRGLDLRHVCPFQACFLVSQSAGCIFVLEVKRHKASKLSLLIFRNLLISLFCIIVSGSQPKYPLSCFLRLLLEKLFSVERESDGSSFGWPTPALWCYPVHGQKISMGVTLQS